MNLFFKQICAIASSFIRNLTKRWSEQLRAADQRAAALAKEVQQLHADNGALAKANEVLHAENTRLWAEIATCRNELADAQARIEKAEQLYATRTQEIQRKSDPDILRADILR